MMIVCVRTKNLDIFVVQSFSSVYSSQALLASDREAKPPRWKMFKCARVHSRYSRMFSASRFCVLVIPSFRIGGQPSQDVGIDELPCGPCVDHRDIPDGRGVGTHNDAHGAVLPRSEAVLAVV